MVRCLIDPASSPRGPGKLRHELHDGGVLSHGAVASVDEVKHNAQVGSSRDVALEKGCPLLSLLLGDLLHMRSRRARSNPCSRLTFLGVVLIAETGNTPASLS